VAGLGLIRRIATGPVWLRAASISRMVVRRLLTIAVIAATVVLTAAADASAAPPGGPLRVGAEVPQPGFWNEVPPGSGSFTGFEHDLATALAQRLGKSGIDVVQVPFNELIAGKGKRFDVAFEQALVTGGDAPIAFSTPYLDFDVGILVRTGTNVPDLATARTLRWGVATAATTPSTYLQRKLKPTAPTKTYPDLAQAVTALEQQQVDAVLDYTVSAMKQASLSGGRLAVVGQLRTGEKLGAVLPKGSRLLRGVNAGIKAFRADGTIGRLAAQYLGGDPSAIPFLTN
jgi:polar amino acid transport system substrate-binding protein